LFGNVLARVGIERAISMNEIADRSSPISEPERLIASGAIRRGLGLESVDLRFGLELARGQMKRGAMQEAFRTHVALVLCDPSDVELQIGLANCALQVEENELALQAASAAIALAPDSPRSYYLSARACIALGHLAEAEEDLADAAALARKARDGQMFAEADQLLTKLRVLAK
jgi:Flp pilus assembly protein TadD